MPALDFPANPTNGQVYQNWIYSTSKGAWQAKPLTPAKTITDDVAPLNPADGDQWFSTVDGVLYIYVVDVDGGQWVESRSAIISDGYYSPNYIINGGFDIWQRGTSFSVGIQIPYTADRWQVIRGSGTAGMTVSRQATGLTGFQYCMRAQRDSGDTNTTAGLQVFQSIESAESIKLAGKTVTFSFYARAGANFSSSGSALNFALKTGTSTDGNIRVGAFGGTATDIANTNFTLTTSWARYTVNANVPANSTQLGFIFSYTPTGTAGANDWFDITGVQLEEGSVATPFRRNANSIQGELAACQRYYFRFTQITTVRIIGLATNWSGGETVFTMPLPVNMRTEPSSASMSNVSSCLFLGNGTNYTGASLSTAYGSTNTLSLVFTLTQPINMTTHVRPINGTIIEASAEL